MAERFKAPVLKTGDPYGSGGSNPSPSVRVKWRLKLRQNPATQPEFARGCVHRLSYERMSKGGAHRVGPSETRVRQRPVDRTLIRWMLKLSPHERLQVLQAHVDLIAVLCRAPSLV